MNEEQGLVKRSTDAELGMEEFSPEAALERVGKARQFAEGLFGRLKDGVDYGMIPGVPKPVLFKPGAENIAFGFNVSPIVRDGNKGEVWDASTGLREYSVILALVHRRSGVTLAEGVGSARAKRSNLKDKKGTIDIERVDNANNTALKMAYKRAYVSAALSLGALSALLTQDADEDEHGRGQAGPTGKPTEPGKDEPTAKHTLSEMFKQVALGPNEAWSVVKQVAAFTDEEGKSHTPASFAAMSDKWAGRVIGELRNVFPKGIPADVTPAQLWEIVQHYREEQGGDTDGAA